MFVGGSLRQRSRAPLKHAESTAKKNTRSYPQCFAAAGDTKKQSGVTDVLWPRSIEDDDDI